MRKFNMLAASICAAMASSPAYAVQFDGFFTVGAATHDDDNKNRYIGSLGDRGITDDLTFETDTRFGLQISSDIAEDTSVVAQILGTGVDSNFNAVVEWAYVDYEFNKYVSLRAGKIKQPVYLVNDYVEVGFAYPWIRPPVEVYYLNNPLNTVNGAEFLISFPIGNGQLSFQPYIGSNRDDIPNTGGVAFFEAENIVGLDIKYSGRGYSVHASNFQCDVTTQGNLIDQPTGFGFDVDVDLNGTGECDVTSAGLNLDIANFVVYAEYSDRTTTDTLSRPFGDQEAWYTTLGYRIGKWLPHITVASIEGKASTTNPPAVSCAQSQGTVAGGGGCVTPVGSFDGGTPLFNFPIAIQTSVTAGLRYELNDSAAVKVEYSVVDIETDQSELASSNQPGFPGMQINYGLFDTDYTKQAPTDTVGVTSIALDVIF